MSTTLATGVDIGARTVQAGLNGDVVARGQLMSIVRSSNWYLIRDRVRQDAPHLNLTNLDVLRDQYERLQAKDEAKEPEPEPKTPKLYRLISDVDAENLPAPEWGIDRKYPQGALVLVFGPRGCGKTFLVLGWAFAHGSGLDWLGRYAARQGPVVYIMAEGSGGLGIRVRAPKTKQPPHTIVLYYQCHRCGQRIAITAAAYADAV